MRCTVLLDAPWREPVEALSAFADEPWAVGLLSGGGGPQARWSYLARRPDATLTVDPGEPADPFEALSALLGPPAPSDPQGPPFQGGVVGLAAYELGARVEPLALARKPGWPDLAAARYLALLAFDHAARRIVAVGRGQTEAAAREQAGEALAWLAAPAASAAAGPLTGVNAAPAASEQSFACDHVTGMISKRDEYLHRARLNVGSAARPGNGAAGRAYPCRT